MQHILLYDVLPNKTHAVLSCNGRPEYCNLAFNQFTFPGTHNSGSGFSGPLRLCQDGSAEDNCIWRNQNLNITAQLQLGIRFLTFDTCILPDHCADVYSGDLGQSRLMACQGGQDDVPFGGYRYADLITEALRQIDDWMVNEVNHNEVIGLQFTNNSPEANKSAIVNELVRLLENRWCPNGNESETCNKSTTDITLNTHYSLSNTWPTLSQAIETNSRIFVFIEDGLNVDELVRVWMNPAPVSMYTFTQQLSINNDCSTLVESAQHCNTSFDLFAATGFMLGVCNTNVQQDCNSQLTNYTTMCYLMRLQYNQTVNVILVNYPEQANVPDTVFDVSNMINERNIETYLPVTYSAQSTTSEIITAENSQRCTCVLSNVILILSIVIVLSL